MATPQRRSRYQLSVERSVRKRSEGWGVSGGVPTRNRWRGVRKGQVFVVLVVVPVLLMLGSVYVHTVAVGLKEEAAQLEEEKTGAEGEGERLEVRVTELSEPGRIRGLARKNLQMRDPDSKELETYGNDGEDVANDGEQKKETAQ